MQIDQPKKAGHTFHVVLNVILAIVYLPLAFMGFMLLMATEISMVETNPLIIASGYVIGYAGLFTAVTAHVCVFISVMLYNAKKRLTSYIVRFIPILTMVLAFLISWTLEWFAKA